MSYQLLLGGYRSTIALTSFDPSTAKIKVISESPAPENASWIEPATKAAEKGESGRVFYSLSEDDDGKAFGLELSGEGVKVTAQRDTNGGPAHVHSMKDGSGVVAANYGGGTVIFFPTTSSHTLVSSSESPNLNFPFPYKDTKAPNADRQDTPHPHQVIEGDGGKLYIPDLGSDRVWIVKRQGNSGLTIEGYLQCPEGSGPRHAVFSKDGKHIYVLTELSQEIFAWPLDATSQSTHPLPQFKCSIAPPTVPPSHAKDPYLGAAELILSPAFPSTLYASNRHELHIKEQDKSYPNEAPEGDAIAIVLLGDTGDNVDQVKYVRTTCDNIRGMAVSPDGKFVALAGQDAGGLEIYQVGGAKGDDWKLAAKEEGLEKITTIVWV